VVADVPGLLVVGTALDGHAAVRLAVKNEADVVLLDIDMPGLDGFAAAQAIRRERPEALLLLHTGAVVEERRRRGVRLGLPVYDKQDLAQTVDLLAARARAKTAGGSARSRER